MAIFLLHKTDLTIILVPWFDATLMHASLLVALCVCSITYLLKNNEDQEQ